MSVTLQVMYPITDATKFDYGYYTGPHVEIVNTHLGAHLESHSISKGLAGGPDTPPGFYAIYTARFADMDSLQAALSGAGPVLADIPNYYNGQPQMLIGEVLL